MLVGLDDIDWSALRNPDVPQMLRDMETADDKAFDRIFDDFMDAVRHQRSLYEVTPFVISFLVQLLVLSNDVARKAYYLLFLADLAEDAERPPQHASQVKKYRESYQIYDALEQASPHFFALASHDDPDISVLSLYTLSFISGIQTQVTPLLKQAFESSDDLFIQITLICAYERCLASVPLSDDYEAGLQQILAWAVSERAFIVRATACVSYIALSKYDPQRLMSLPEAILDLLVRSFEVDIFALAAEAADASAFYYPRALMALVPFVSDMELIDPNQTMLWLLIVQKSNMTPEVSFTCVRRLLDCVFNGFDDQDNNLSTEAVTVVMTTKNVSKNGKNTQDSGSPSIMYEHSPGLGEFFPGFSDSSFYFFRDYEMITLIGLYPHKPGEPFTDLQHQALEVVLACEAFWQIETNLLSFFYGLPDDREALRALLAASL